MANRAYLYSLDNRPSGYADRPETISGLSEWPYNIPFMYRLLMSGDPRLCASLIADGLEDDDPARKSRLHAISSAFDPGFERVKRFVDIVRHHATPPLAQPAPPAAATSWLGRAKRWLAPQPAPVAAASTAEPSQSTSELLARLDQTLAFLHAHRNRYLLLETIELDCMSEEEEGALRQCVEREIEQCLRAGAAIDALSPDLAEAARQLEAAITDEAPSPLDALFELRLDDECDNTQDDATDYPLGLEWSDVLYFELMNRAEFEAREQ